MTIRFMIFVDGSNLFGTLRHLNVRVDDYEKLYRHIFDLAIKQWQTSLIGPIPTSQLVRTYWYVVGNMDDWRLEDAKAQVVLRERFEENTDVRKLWLAQAGKSLADAGKPHDAKAIAAEAWVQCFSDFKTWYEAKWRILDGMNRFHHRMKAVTDFIEVCPAGHWKVDFFSKSLTEKGLDTAFAVDMVGLAQAYDVAILISGDADSIPSLNYVKRLGKHVAVVEFLKGYPPETRGKNSASQLKVASDFVVQVYEMELVKSGIAIKGEPTLDAPSDGKALEAD